MRSFRFLTGLYLTILLIGAVFPFGSRISYTLSNNYVLQIRWDYLIHVFLYMPMPILLGLNFSKRLAGSMPLVYWLVVAGGTLVLTVLYESLQLLVPYRYFNINDMASNMVGALAGLVLLVTFPFTLRRIQARIFPASSR